MPGRQRVRPADAWRMAMNRFKAMQAMAFLAAALGTTSALAQSSFRFDRSYSQQDGRLQWIELTETGGLDNQHRFTGLTLTVTSHGLSKTFTFPNDLPSSSTAHRHVTLVSTTFASCCMSPAEDAPEVPLDYVLPNGFLPIDGGTLSFGGVDEWTFGPAPVDGYFALERSGALVKGEAITFSGGAVSATNYEGFGLVAIEYYNAALDHYFMTSLAPEIAALDSGAIAGWMRTGQSFNAYAAPVVDADPVCRFYLPAPRDSHFFTASPVECGYLTSLYPTFVLESPNAFYIPSPDATTGACPGGTTPVYRLYNNRPDTDHRFTTDLAIKAQMVAKGYIPEGYGPDAVIMCAPG
jgi:hypothetical protein